MLHLFIPHKFAANRAHLVQAGAGDLLRPDDATPQCVDLEGPGPGSLPGQVWSWPSERNFPRYTPETQSWYQARGAGYWYGFDHGMPFEEALRREQPFRGKSEVLAGEAWSVPTVEHVPHRLDLDAAGNLIKVPDAPYERFAADAGELMNGWRDFTRNQIEPPWTWQRLAGFVVAALGLNYRINLEIACRLGLLRDDELLGLAFRRGAAAEIAAILEELAKKKPADTPPGSAPSGG